MRANLPRLLKTLVALATGVFLLLFAMRQQQPIAPAIQSLEGATMGTTWQVQVVAEQTPQLAALGQQIIKRLNEMDKVIFSTYASDSELSRLNQAPVGQAVPTSRELAEVLLWSRTINRQSEGAFDVTVGPLVDLWGFGPLERQGVPSQTSIDAAWKRLGSNQYDVDLRAGTATRLADIRIDLSAIAKGYAVDEIAELLEQAGYLHFLVEIGGEVRVQGWRAPEQSWQIAIERPEAALPRQAFALVHNQGQTLSLAGSGDYRNFFEAEAKRYSHEIDPRTGYPIQHALAAVTVLADTTAEADAWATALMVLGPEEGINLAEQRKLPAYFIIRDAAGWRAQATSSMDAYLVAVNTE